MRKFRFVATVATTLALALPAFAVQYDIDSAHSSAGFAVKHLVVSTVRGTLGKVTGTAVLDPADPTKSTVSASIEVAGIDTNNADRDAHLVSPDFLDAKQFPTITFQSTKVEKVSDAQYKVSGNLTLRGVTKAVVLDVEGSTTPVTDSNDAAIYNWAGVAKVSHPPAAPASMTSDSAINPAPINT